MMDKSKLIKKMKSLSTSLNDAVGYAENHILNHNFPEAQVAIATTVFSNQTININNQ